MNQVKTIAGKVAVVIAHIAVATQLATLLAAAAHNASLQQYWWAINIAQVIVVQLVSTYDPQAAAKEDPTNGPSSPSAPAGGVPVQA